MGVSMNGGTLKQMVYFMEYPILKWMMNRGTPILGNLHIYIYVYIYIYIYNHLSHPSSKSQGSHLSLCRAAGGVAWGVEMR